MGDEAYPAPPRVCVFFQEMIARSGWLLNRTEGVDTSRFRPGIDPAKAVTLINVCVEGLRNLYACRVSPEMVDRPDDVEAMMQETREYLDMLKFGIYRRK